MFCMRFVTFLDILQNYIVETIKYYLILFPRTKLSCSTICNAYLGPQTWRTVNYFSLLYLPNSVDGLFLPNVPCLVKTNRFFRTLPFFAVDSVCFKRVSRASRAFEKVNIMSATRRSGRRSTVASSLASAAGKPIRPLKTG